jgi:hypothetical protein
MMNTNQIERGCGFRVEGGIYAEVPVGKAGVPLERFMYCEPITRVANNKGEIAPIAQAWGLSPRGVSLIAFNGHVNVVDIVGSSDIDGYYNAADILEETRLYGLSRRLELQEQDYALLGPGSLLVLAHARGSKINASDYALDRPDPYRWCPKNLPEHEPSILTGMCACLHYEGLMGANANDALNPRAVTRTVGDTEYSGFAWPEGVDPDKHELALIAGFPIHNLAVVKHPDADKQAEAMDKARRTAFSISLDEF